MKNINADGTIKSLPRGIIAEIKRHPKYRLYCMVYVNVNTGEVYHYTETENTFHQFDDPAIAMVGKYHVGNAPTREELREDINVVIYKRRIDISIPEEVA